MKQKGLCRALLLILFATCAVAGRAQEVLRSDSVTGVDAGKESLKIQPSASEVTPEKVGARLALTDTLVADTAQWAFRPSLPPLYRNGTVAYFPASYYGGYWGLWELHEGFNACLDMSVSASFGKNRWDSGPESLPCTCVASPTGWCCLWEAFTTACLGTA